MQHIKFFKDLSKRDVGIAGGKGASLGEMTRAGIAVPLGFVVTASAFDRFLQETNLKAEIDSIVHELNYKDIHRVEHASETIRDLIHDERMPKDLQVEILEAYHKLAARPSPRPSPPPEAGRRGRGGLSTSPLPKGEGGRRSGEGFLVAVRSSATAEDSSQASWAGELESYLNTTEKVLLGNVKQCWSSLFTPRALVYRNEKGMHKAHVSVAVVVQKMVQSEIAGVCFTVHPVTKDRHQMIIEACWGLGEALVGGQVTPDAYVIDKRDWSLIDVSVSEQKKMITRRGVPPLRVRGGREGLRSAIRANRRTIQSPSRTTRRLSDGGGTREVVVPDKFLHRQKLDGRQIVELAKLCAKIETHYKFPCDIEWALESGKFYIVQSRPITTL
ncbi:hypothetical protein A3B21_03155 [Candidatus Uhrbacteria bacterium RIFCSPLOWO2_01_FULL_47_24]|uniref:Phosphoenolpyruvate synthase n=1 Tax=Candidatus Uhrbacteria bacterium RIFCSPLOWO2_01_FULL_47_24 TaxID=1802401 RepID=A0A1F7URR3_9BACT|nr:MAG: hypothetical protein A3D58_03755 [Candidatus Uhrbacteria bacterium RIFCSPHIGHO2_02_FULL_46_47]OGL75776.1 MAG: hypothetical protein A3F52_05570 [Candidatus Uhrbacteria bacterium RIFCSPHIGHO2_12_FULL_47_11]OGL80939.1 MAG: hypothetical protein A3B21_03155 [Candidatus Uhrbacteria bacterium RIFCSPLOWO2_01_FULL_47_24]OGL84274.1 MAG: hypothetical protein A3J03_03155 [Candidatus Uhrbacteria bacterium RIFCSPLOWO2_02_FULL_46_25]OGL93284.1 MAG: hypothetical protein A3H11_02920 [Candidatus Uhrbacte